LKFFLHNVYYRFSVLAETQLDRLLWSIFESGYHSDFSPPFTHTKLALSSTIVIYRHTNRPNAHSVCVSDGGK